MDEKVTEMTPRPDPTELTTLALMREIEQLKELLFARLGQAAEYVDEKFRGASAGQAQVVREIDELRARIVVEAKASREVLETRLDGNDKAIELLQAASDRFPARIDEKITSLAQVHEEKFRSIQTQFTERDVRTDQTSRDSKVAVDAALQAAKEAVGEQNRSSALAIAKSETATMKQIDQMGLLIQTTAKASDEKIDDIKERLTRIEGKGSGRQDMWGWVVGAIAIVLALYAALRTHL